MILLDIANKKFLQQKIYVFDLIFFILGLKYEIYNGVSEDNDIIISYGEKPLKEMKDYKGIFIKDSGELFNGNYLKRMPKININKYSLDEPIKYIKDVISLFSKDEDYIYRDNYNTLINVDIISDIFFLVTRYEEVMVKSKDMHDRFNPMDSVAYKENFIDRPVVNEQIELLWRELKLINPSLKRKNMWGDKEFGFCLSHDIDSIFKYKDKIIKVLGVKILKERDIKGAVERVKNYFKAIKNPLDDPFWTFPYLLKLENKYKFTASYYFMTGGETKKDNIYKITNGKLATILKEIKANKSEIGIHGSYNSYNNSELLKTEIRSLNDISKVSGIRQHYLRFRAPYTWRIQEVNKLKYDTTLGYAQIAGFRGSICTPFKPYDLINNKVMNIYEIPLVLMDGTLLEAEYMGLSAEDGLLYAKKLIDRIKAVKGVFTLLWHNSSFDNTSKWGSWKFVYEDILEYVYEEQALGLSGEALIKHVEYRTD
ncbi:MAG: polysaccharide deacetylase family protein [Clostridium sp.]|uniref:polysaccharide deacetylase family protein n=1 Tax=Clostridium sp. TaxID=1506 RepID=UPI003034255B